MRAFGSRGGWCFFFSSRRRHTRFDCDWSSDVCSSDLGGGAATAGRTTPGGGGDIGRGGRSEEHTSELQSQSNLVCRLLLEKKKKLQNITKPLSVSNSSYFNIVTINSRYAVVTSAS